MSRRHFLFAATTGAAAGAVALTDSKQTAPSAGEAMTSRASGYQATEHVRNYYRTARI
jgi:hypothetical protein